MAEDHGAPGAEEVEVAVSVFVEEPGALGVSEEGRVSAYCAKSTDGRIDAPREEFFGALLQLAGAGEDAGHGSSIGGEDAGTVWLEIAAPVICTISRNSYPKRLHTVPHKTELPVQTVSFASRPVSSVLITSYPRRCVQSSLTAGKKKALRRDVSKRPR